MPTQRIFHLSWIWSDPDIYCDIYQLTDPMQEFRIPFKIGNSEDIELWFQVVGSLVSGDAAAWTFTTQNLGSIVAGGTGSFTYTGAQRAKPTLTDMELVETIRLTLKAYTDSAYTDLYDERSWDMNVYMFDSTRTGVTEIFRTDFDDGTLQGWTATPIDGTIGLTTESYRSPSYSVKSEVGTGGGENSLSRSVTVGTYSKCYAIIHWQYGILHIYFDGVLKYKTEQIGVEWSRLCFPFPVDATTTLDIRPQHPTGTVPTVRYLDDLAVVAW